MSLAKYVGIRIAQVIPTLFGAILVMFILIRILPGDPARLIAGPEASPEDVERLREQLGLNAPLYVQLMNYISSILVLDLGTSLKYGTPVLNEIMARFPYTLVLALTAQAIAIIVAIPLGIYSAIKPRSKLTYVSSVVSVIGASTPIFWIGLILIFVFAVTLNVLPSSGAESPRHLILPAFTLSLFLMGNLARITRASVSEALANNFVVTARAKGLKWRIILIRHVLRNAMIPIITVMGIQLGTLLGGAVITETVFAWPGIGSLLIDSLFFRDYPLAQGIILFVIFIFVVLNIVVDVIYAYVDPRVREVLWAARRF